MPKKHKPEPRPSPFPLRLEPDLRKRLEELAAAERRSLTNFLMNVIQERVAQEDGGKPVPREYGAMK